MYRLKWNTSLFLDIVVTVSSCLFCRSFKDLLLRKINVFTSFTKSQRLANDKVINSNSYLIETQNPVDFITVEIKCLTHNYIYDLKKKKKKTLWCNTIYSTVVEWLFSFSPLDGRVRISCMYIIVFYRSFICLMSPLSGLGLCSFVVIKTLVE